MDSVDRAGEKGTWGRAGGNYCKDLCEYALWYGQGIVLSNCLRLLEILHDRQSLSVKSLDTLV